MKQIKTSEYIFLSNWEVIVNWVIKLLIKLLILAVNDNLIQLLLLAVRVNYNLI